jgi:hypothetical protein
MQRRQLNITRRAGLSTALGRHDDEIGESTESTGL